MGDIVKKESGWGNRERGLKMGKEGSCEKPEGKSRVRIGQRK